MDGKTFSIGFAIEKVDAERRQVWGYATVEEPDRQGDIVDYKGSIDAFSKWPGNIREQHRKDKAVGVCIDWKPVPEKRAIWVGAQLSKSQDGQDTWTKIQEGVLKGFSIGGVELESKPEVVKSNGKTVNRITKYRLDELSIVDNPACPSAAIHLVKSVDGELTVSDVVEKTTVSTSGNEPMAPDMGSDAGAQSQHGQTPPQSGKVQTDDSDGVCDTDEADENTNEETTAADANLSVDAPSMPTPDTAKPNGLMDQRGKHINAGGSKVAAAGSLDEFLTSLDGMTPAQKAAALSKAVMQHLQERNEGQVEKKGSDGVRPEAADKVEDAPISTEKVASPAEIGKMFAEFRAGLLAEVSGLLKANSNDNDKMNDNDANEHDGEGDKDPDDDGDDDTEPDKDTDHDAAPKGKAVEPVMQKSELTEDHVRRVAADVLIKATGSLEKSLGDLLEKSLVDIEDRLSKAAAAQYAELEGRVKRVESLPGYPDGSPAVREVDKSLGDMPGMVGKRTPLTNELAKHVRDDRNAPASLREEAGRMLALEDMRGIFGGS